MDLLKIFQESRLFQHDSDIEHEDLGSDKGSDKHSWPFPWQKAKESF